MVTTKEALWYTMPYQPTRRALL